MPPDSIDWFAGLLLERGKVGWPEIGLLADALEEHHPEPMLADYLRDHIETLELHGSVVYSGARINAYSGARINAELPFSSYYLDRDQNRHCLDAVKLVIYESLSRVRTRRETIR